MSSLQTNYTIPCIFPTESGLLHILCQFQFLFVSSILYQFFSLPLPFAPNTSKSLQAVTQSFWSFRATCQTTSACDYSPQLKHQQMHFLSSTVSLVSCKETHSPYL